MIDLNEARERILAAKRSWVKGSKNYAGRDTIQKMFGLTDWGARALLKQLNESGFVDPPTPSDEPIGDATETNEVRGDTWTIGLPKTRIHTLQQLVEYCEVDEKVWEVERFVCNKWEVGAKDGEGSIRVEPLFQVKAWLKKRKNVQAAMDALKWIEDRAASFAPRYPAIIFNEPVKSGNMLEIALTDHHFGKLAWGKETGWENYDLKIAEESYKTAFSTIINRTKQHRPEEIVIVVGSDQQHSDNRQGTTTGGTPQDVDGRYYKVCDVSLDASIWAVELASTVAPKVRVVVVPGNHDFITSWHLGRTLEAWFRNAPQVTVDSRPLFRKYIQHGVNMICWTHGNDVRWDGLPLLMAQEQPQMWGRTKWKEIHTGDKHQRKLRLEEFNGVAVRILPSLCPPDSWHSSKGFVGNLRVGEAYVWNDREGLIDTSTYSILPNQEQEPHA